MTRKPLLMALLAAASLAPGLAAGVRADDTVDGTRYYRLHPDLDIYAEVVDEPAPPPAAPTVHKVAIKPTAIIGRPAETQPPVVLQPKTSEAPQARTPVAHPPPASETKPKASVQAKTKAKPRAARKTKVADEAPRPRVKHRIAVRDLDPEPPKRTHRRRETSEDIIANSLDPACNYCGYPSWARAALSGNRRR